MPDTVTTTREQNRADTLRRIVAASRGLVTGTGEMTLRSVASEVGMTAPALYRYVDSHEELVRIVAVDIDASAAEEIARARDAHPPDDPAARKVASAVAFRQWALRNREEFSLVFTNLDVSCIEELNAESSTGMLFSELLFQVWATYRFPVPRLADLDPALVEILHDPVVPADLSGVPEGQAAVGPSGGDPVLGDLRIPLQQPVLGRVAHRPLPTEVGARAPGDPHEGLVDVDDRPGA